MLPLGSQSSCTGSNDFATAQFCTPLVALPDCRVLANHVDAFLLVVTAHKTPRRLLEAALGAVDPERILGLVFNGDDAPTAQYGRWFRNGQGRNGASG